MVTESLAFDRAETGKLLGAANADAALLYIFIKAGNPPEEAETALRMSAARVSCAMAALRQLGLYREEKNIHILPGERPDYSEEDVLSADRHDSGFISLRGEVERVLGRTLHTEELKMLLGFMRYLGMPVEVISMLVSYCKEEARRKGRIHPPSLRSIEKEAYAWAERGIETMEDAAAFIQAQNVRNTRLGRLMELLQIRGRSLTGAEERYADSWLRMGFEDEAVAMAYERTCLNTGGMNWAYMNKILQRWHEAGLHTAEAVRSGDRKPGTKAQERQLDADEQAAIARMMREG